MTSRIRIRISVNCQKFLAKIGTARKVVQGTCVDPIYSTLERPVHCHVTLKERFTSLKSLWSNRKISLHIIIGTYLEVRIPLQRHNNENSKQIFPEMELRGYSPNSYIHVSVGDLYFPTICLPILLQENRWTDHGNI